MPKVFRLSEQYLIRAEAYVQKEQPEYGKAGTDISTLRLARYSTYGSGTTPMNKDNAMDIIEQERRFPLARPETLAQRVRTQAAGTVVGKR